ncbi:hypothetical protein Tco_0881121 [Tanacetum coccineum]
MEVGTTTTNLTARLPILNPGDCDLWLMRIEQYFLMTDYSLWEVIKNGNKVLRRTVGTVEQEYEPTIAEEKHDRRNEMKERATLLMALLNKDQLKFHSYQDAKLLMEAIEKRYGGNKESKKVQRTLLKQQYENFAALCLVKKWLIKPLLDTFLCDVVICAFSTKTTPSRSSTRTSKILVNNSSLIDLEERKERKEMVIFNGVGHADN